MQHATPPSLSSFSLPPSSSSSLIGGGNHLPCQSTTPSSSPALLPHSLAARPACRAFLPHGAALPSPLLYFSLFFLFFFVFTPFPLISLAPDPSLSRSIRSLAATAPPPSALPPSSPTAPLFSLLSRQRQGRSWSHSGPFWWAKDGIWIPCSLIFAARNRFPCSMLVEALLPVVGQSLAPMRRRKSSFCLAPPLVRRPHRLFRRTKMGICFPCSSLDFDFHVLASRMFLSD